MKEKEAWTYLMDHCSDWYLCAGLAYLLRTSNITVDISVAMQKKIYQCLRFSGKGISFCERGRHTVYATLLRKAFCQRMIYECETQ